jgi:hypothetical protein
MSTAYCKFTFSGVVVNLGRTAAEGETLTML